MVHGWFGLVVHVRAETPTPYPIKKDSYISEGFLFLRDIPTLNRLFRRIVGEIVGSICCDLGIDRQVAIKV